MIDQGAVLPLGHEDPRQIAQYAVEGRLGAGGQGVVYLGRGPDGRPVAVKVLKAMQGRDRFEREVAAARRVPQAHTAAILDADVLGERPYIVSEYVPGLSLQAAVERNGVFTGHVLERLATHTITALAAIHGARVVHRDFKPANVLIGPDGPRVVDFGIAHALESGGHMTSSLLGTPPYMSPEQLNEQPAGPHTDVFAWAATMVFAATGRPPFGQGPFAAVAHRILHGAPNLEGVPAPLHDVLARCLAKDPAERPSSLQVLQSLIGHGTVVEPELPRLALQQARPPDGPAPGPAHGPVDGPIGGPVSGRAGGGPGSRAVGRASRPPRRRGGARAC
ncbi:serine/threonine-protein kinase [Nonomuraea thailandensis]